MIQVPLKKFFVLIHPDYHMQKKWLLVFVFVVFTAITVSAQVTILIVRHAEKEQSSSRDPELSEEGKARSKELDRMLRKVSIDEVYATPYKRTRNTVAPVAERIGVDIKSYDPSAQDKFASILKGASGKTILVAGHSNTIPALLNLLTGKKDHEDMPETEYDNLFVVSIAKDHTNVVCLKFGVATE